MPAPTNIADAASFPPMTRLARAPRGLAAAIVAVALAIPLACGCHRVPTLQRTAVKVTPGTPEGQVPLCVFSPTTYDDPMRGNVSMIALHGPGWSGQGSSFTVSAMCANNCSDASLTAELTRKQSRLVGLLENLHNNGTGHVTVDTDDVVDGVRVVTVHATFDKTYQEWASVRAVECVARRPGDQYVIEVDSITPASVNGDEWDLLKEACRRSTGPPCP